MVGFTVSIEIEKKAVDEHSLVFGLPPKWEVNS